jgi:hypothetical protein
MHCMRVYERIMQSRLQDHVMPQLLALGNLTSMSVLGPHLADRNDGNALPACYAQPGHAQVVQVLPPQLCGPNRPPAWFQECRHAAVLQDLCPPRAGMLMHRINQSTAQHSWRIGESICMWVADTQGRKKSLMH